MVLTQRHVLYSDGPARVLEDVAQHSQKGTAFLAAVMSFYVDAQLTGDFLSAAAKNKEGETGEKLLRWLLTDPADAPPCSVCWPRSQLDASIRRLDMGGAIRAATENTKKGPEMMAVIRDPCGDTVFTDSLDSRGMNGVLLCCTKWMFRRTGGWGAREVDMITTFNKDKYVRIAGWSTADFCFASKLLS